MPAPKQRRKRTRAAPKRPAEPPFLYFVGEHPDDCYRSTAITVFFAKEPSDEERAAVLATVPAPLKADVEFVGRVLRVASDEFPWVDVVLNYDPDGVALARDEKLSIDDDDRRDVVAEQLTDDASRELWARFFSDLERWLREVAARHELVLVHSDSPLYDNEVLRHSSSRVEAAIAPVILPLLSALGERPEFAGEARYMLQLVAQSIASWAEERAPASTDAAQRVFAALEQPGQRAPKSFEELAAARDAVGFLDRAGATWPKAAWNVLADLDGSSAEVRAFLLAVAEAAAAQARPTNDALCTLFTAAAEADDAGLLTKLLAGPDRLRDCGWQLSKCGSDALDRGSFAIARLLLDRAVDVRGYDQPGSLLLCAHDGLLDAGNADPELIRRDIARVLPRANKDGLIFQNAAWLYLRLGQLDAAREIIARARKAKFKGLAKLKKDPDFAPLFRA